jgi:hypothetical protein
LEKLTMIANLSARNLTKVVTPFDELTAVPLPVVLNRGSSLLAETTELNARTRIAVKEIITKSFFISVFS